MTNLLSEDILILLVFLHKIITMPSPCPRNKKGTSDLQCLKCFKHGHWTFQCPLVTGGDDGKKKSVRKSGSNIMTMDDLKKKERKSGGSCRNGSCSKPSKSKGCSGGSCGIPAKKSYSSGGGCCSGGSCGMPKKKNNCSSGACGKPSKKSCSGGSCSKRGGYKGYSSGSDDSYSDDSESESEGSDFDSDYSDSESGSDSDDCGRGGCYVN